MKPAHWRSVNWRERSSADAEAVFWCAIQSPISAVGTSRALSPDGAISALGLRSTRRKSVDVFLARLTPVRSRTSSPAPELGASRPAVRSIRSGLMRSSHSAGTSAICSKPTRASIETMSATSDGALQQTPRQRRRRIPIPERIGSRQAHAKLSRAAAASVSEKIRGFY
jgi:hypothetical protein